MVQLIITAFLDLIEEDYSAVLQEWRQYLVCSTVLCVKIESKLCYLAQLLVQIQIDSQFHTLHVNIQSYLLCMQLFRRRIDRAIVQKRRNLIKRKKRRERKYDDSFIWEYQFKFYSNVPLCAIEVTFLSIIGLRQLDCTMLLNDVNNRRVLWDNMIFRQINYKIWETCKKDFHFKGISFINFYKMINFLPFIINFQSVINLLRIIKLIHSWDGSQQGMDLFVWN